MHSNNPPMYYTISGVGEGGGGGQGRGATAPPTLGHDCTLKFNEEKISSCSSYLVSIEAIARLISMKQLLSKFLRQIVLKAVSQHKNAEKFLRSMPPDLPRCVGNN